MINSTIMLMRGRPATNIWWTFTIFLTFVTFAQKHVQLKTFDFVLIFRHSDKELTLFTTKIKHIRDLHQPNNSCSVLSTTETKILACKLSNSFVSRGVNL